MAVKVYGYCTSFLCVPPRLLFLPKADDGDNHLFSTPLITTKTMLDFFRSWLVQTLELDHCPPLFLYPYSSRDHSRCGLSPKTIRHVREEQIKLRRIY